jgi:signal transduction histidine kinase
MKEDLKIKDISIESIFYSIMANRADTVWAVDRDLIFRYFNNKNIPESFQLEYPESHEHDLLLGEHALAGVEGEEKEFWFNKYHSALNGHRDTFEWTFTKDLKKILYQIEINPIIIEGEIVGASCLSRDITNEKKLKKDLKNSEDLLQILASNFMGVVFIIDKEGIFRLSQGKGLEKLSLKPNQVVGQSVYEIYKDYPENGEMIKRCLNGEDHFSAIVTVDNTVFDSNLQALYDDEGNINGVLGVSLDITQRKIMEQELEASRETLKHMEKMQAIGQLAGGVAHDFNNQLMGIYGFTELINQEVEEGSKIKEYARSIIEATDHSAKLTSQLLTFARKGEINHTKIDIHGLIGKMLDLLTNTFDKKFKVKLALQAENPFLKGNASELQNCLLNMAINSRDAMAEGGSLTIATENQSLDRREIEKRALEMEPGEYLLLKITDTGCGMDQETLKRVFEPFYTTKGLKKGTGMGLPMVYGAVKKHRGDIKIKSTPKRGTEILIYLPTVENAAIS